MSPEAVKRLKEGRPVARCEACNRAAWEPGEVGAVCGMTRPDGSPCDGRFLPVAPDRPRAFVAAAVRVV